MRQLANIVLTLGLALSAAPAFADIADRVNTIRSSGCNGKAGISTPLRESRNLNAVAREWSKGGRLSTAFERVEYRVVRSASMRVTGSNTEKALADLMRRRYCNTIIDPDFTEIGVFRRGATAWVVVAAPFVLPRDKDADTMRKEILALVNEARSKPRTCGKKRFEAAPPLKLSSMLTHAALVHSQDMSRKNFFDHEGSDGSKVADRVARAGYRWRTVGENIAAGAENAQVVVRGWLDSPGHCSNIMRAQYTEMGLACVTNIKSSPGIYWTQVFATPR